MNKVAVLLLGAGIALASTAHAQLKMIVHPQDNACPPNMRLAKEIEVGPIRCHDMLNEWDIARIAGGASVGGPGYKCKVTPQDSRKLGHSICITDIHKTMVKGVVLHDPALACPAGSRLVSAAEVKSQEAAVRKLFKGWETVRLAEGASMGGPKHHFQILPTNREILRQQLCTETASLKPFIHTVAECPPGKRLANHNEVQANREAACAAIGEVGLARFNGGVLGGKQMNCAISGGNWPTSKNLCVNN